MAAPPLLVSVARAGEAEREVVGCGNTRHPHPAGAHPAREQNHVSAVTGAQKDRRARVTGRAAAHPGAACPHLMCCLGACSRARAQLPGHVRLIADMHTAFCTRTSCGTWSRCAADALTASTTATYYGYSPTLDTPDLHSRDGSACGATAGTWRHTRVITGACACGAHARLSVQCARCRLNAGGGGKIVPSRYLGLS